MKEEIERLCQKHTDLSRKEINYIKQIFLSLPFLADTEEADVFINCPCPGGDSVVVAQAKPRNASSAYRKYILGMFARRLNEPAVDRTLRLGCATRRMKALNQENVPVIQVATPIRYEGKTIGVLTYERFADGWEDGQPFHELFGGVGRNTECDAEKCAARTDWEWVVNCIEEGIILIDCKGFVIFRNAIARQLYKRLGYMEDILGQEYRNICLDKMDMEREAFTEELQMGRYSLRIRKIPDPMEGVSFAVFVSDVTHIKNQERELVLKSVAVQEMHHRVKNNLQTIVSLIRLQVRRIENLQAHELLEETADRIQTIATTHQLLAKKGIDWVSLQEVLGVIADNAIRANKPEQKEVSISVAGKDCMVNSNLATTIALVVNELIHNSLEHAFVGKTKGSIRIRTGKEMDLYGTVSVEDDGRGFDVSRPGHLGLNIVEVLVKEKLRGSLTIASNKNGTHTSFGFQI